jgi:hypothetical protein
VLFDVVDVVYEELVTVQGIEIHGVEIEEIGRVYVGMVFHGLKIAPDVRKMQGSGRKTDISLRRRGAIHGTRWLLASAPVFHPDTFYPGLDGKPTVTTPSLAGTE